jgi:pimeloyl-ACP methyl ester carboxylesterase
MRRGGLVAWLLVTSFVAGACGGEPSTPPAREGPQEPPAISESPYTLDGLLAQGEEVTFKGGFGDTLEGRLFGQGDVGVVLAHGYSPEGGQGDWLPVGPALAERGYAALTFNFTGFCPEDGGLPAGCSGGKEAPTQTWRDIEPAVDFLRGRGAQDVFVVGSSMGGQAALTAAARTDVEIAGVVAMAAPREAPPEFPQNMNLTDEIIQAVDEPKLFVAGEGDGQAAADAEAMHDLASEPKDVVILDSPFHGLELITRAEPNVSTEAMAALLAFLGANGSA